MTYTDHGPMVVKPLRPGSTCSAASWLFASFPPPPGPGQSATADAPRDDVPWPKAGAKIGSIVVHFTDFTIKIEDSR